MRGLNPKGRSASSNPRGPRFVSLTNENRELPNHERLYQRIRSLVLSGDLSFGSRLASSRALSDNIGISRNSVLMAFERLIADGWLESRRGSGVYVVYSGRQMANAAKASSAPDQPYAQPFTLRVPPLDLFPTRVWHRLQSRHWKQMSAAALQESEPAGWLALREAVAAHVAITRGLQCSAQQVMITSGMTASINLLVRALGLRGKEVWIEDPGHDGARQALQNCDMRLIPIAVDAQGINVPAANIIAPGAKLAYVTPACQFPTCAIMAPERRKQLLEWAEANSAWIFEDDYGCYSGVRKQNPLPLAASHSSRVVYFGSFNYVVFPGLRIAYIIASADLIDRFAAIRTGMDGPSNAPNQVVMANFINGGHLDEHLRRLNVSTIERREVLVHAFERHLADFMTIRETSIGSHVVCNLHGLQESELEQEARNHALSVTGMGRFRLVPNDTNEILIGYGGFKPEALVAAAGKLRTVCEAIASRKS
jgi:GntR family transcriptional regulator/MocR family aminotransferase